MKKSSPYFSNLIPFIPVILFFTVGYIFADPVNLFSNLIMYLIVFSHLITTKITRSRINFAEIVLALLFISLVISSVIQQITIQEALFGSYKRNSGLLFYLSLIVIFWQVNRAEATVSNHRLHKVVDILSISSCIYGLIQILDIDPIQWKNEAAIQLTLGNINFAGALFGILGASQLSRLYFSSNQKKVSKNIRIALLITVIFCGSMTRTLQFYLVLVIGTIPILVFNSIRKVRVRKENNISFDKSLFATACLVFVFVIAVFINSHIQNWIYKEGNIEARLQYWRIGLKIFLENPWFGVGPDQFSYYSLQSRTSQLVFSDGLFVIPDKSHSVFIDLFAAGGLFAGIFWLAFVCNISIICIKNIIYFSDIGDGRNLQISQFVSCIWFAYVAQTSISPSHVLLDSLGIIAAANAYSLKRKVLNNTAQFDKLSVGLLLKAPAIFLAPLMILVLTLSVDVARGEFYWRKLQQNEFNEIWFKKALKYSWSGRQIGINGLSLSKIRDDCNLAQQISRRALEISTRNEWAWYGLSICMIRQNKLNNAVPFLERAVKLDPSNYEYLDLLARLYASQGNRKKAVPIVESIERKYGSSLDTSSLRFLINSVS